MTARASRHAIRERLRMLVKLANGAGGPVVYAVKEIKV